MYSGTDSPYKGESERTAEIVNKTYGIMKDFGLDTRRLRLAAICYCMCASISQRDPKNERSA